MTPSNPASDQRMPMDQYGATLQLGEQISGHGAVTGVRWPIGICNGCGGRIVNIDTDEGHGPHGPSNPASGTNEAAELVTQAGRDLLRWNSHGPGGYNPTNAVYWSKRILAIEEEAAALATERAIGAALDVEQAYFDGYMAGAGDFTRTTPPESEVRRYAVNYARPAFETPRPGGRADG